MVRPQSNQVILARLGHDPIELLSSLSLSPLISLSLTSHFSSNMPMILLLYKEVYFNSKELDSCVPSGYVSFLQQFDVFLDEILSGLSPIKGIEH